MKGYPTVLSEEQTIAAAQAGCSIARAGDGEYKVALGANCVSQRYHPELAKELRAVLANPVPGLLMCIPNIVGVSLPAAKVKGWAQYARQPYLGLLGKMTYGSAFISRPDSAPWIDTPEYWASVRALWAGRDVILATGRYNEIRLNQLEGAASVVEIECPRQHAYAEIERIQADILREAETKLWPLVIMCLGPTATVLAARLQRTATVLAARLQRTATVLDARLQRLSVQALDLGHLGMFLRHAGQYLVQPDEVASPAYRAELRAMHASEKGWGADGHSHAPVVRTLIADLNPKTILDYGCGQGTLRQALEGEFRVLEYDPGVEGKEGMPKPVDLVVCTDVLEHVEVDRVDAVLRHIERVAEVAAYLAIALSPAKRELPITKRNAHLSIHEASWWIDRIAAAGFKRVEVLEGKGLCVVAYR